jgi:DNA gyrase subunit B
MSTTVKSYDSENIKTLQFPENIRKKPTLYIGPIDESGIFTILREVADNVVDEALAGRATVCDVMMKRREDGNLRGFFILDNGQGIPVKPIQVENPFDGKKVKVPAIKAILTMTHTSGKFDDSAYAAARGTHGLGIKASNALSRKYEVWTFRDGSWFHISYKAGKSDKDLTKVNPPSHPISGKPLKQGTLVYMEPDPLIFSVMGDRKLSDIFSLKSPTTTTLLEWCRIASYFTEGLKIRVHHFSGATKEFYSENGPDDFIARKFSQLNKARLAEDEKAELVALMTEKAKFSVKNALLECVVAFTNSDVASLDAFTNGLRNSEGGVHLTAMMSAMHNAIQPFIPKGKVFTQRELREGVVSLINVKLSAPQFNSQTKEKLVDERGARPVYDFLTEAFTNFFKKDRDLTSKICDRAASLHALRSKFMASKKVLNSLRNMAKKGLPVKGTFSPNCKPEDRELYIIEGDSAAGPAKDARDPFFQETLPIRGKIFNALRDPKGKAVNSEEIINILAQLGFDPKSPDPYARMRVQGKIICLADPDPDGPLVGSVEVPIRYDGDWHTVSMETLASEEWRNREYEVVSWNGRAFCLGDAYDCRVTDYVNKLVKIVFEDDTKLQCAVHHKFPLNSGSMVLRDLLPDITGLLMAPASGLKVGDVICAGEDSHLSCLPKSILGKPSLAGMKIKKLKIVSTEPTPVYCLTVRGFHNFMLANGVLSKNCHINSLLLSLLYRFLPGLYAKGMVYVAETPEFYAVDKKGKPYFASKSDALSTMLASKGIKAEVEHIKGYGEVSSEILRLLAFNPETRNITRIVPSVDPNGDLEFVKLMSGGSESRKALLGI